MKTYKLSDIKGMSESISKMEIWRSTTGNLYGSTWGLETGKLPKEHEASFDRCDYAIYSYETPIAWYRHMAGEWYIPVKYYSVSTSRHLAIVRQAIALTAGQTEGRL